MQYDIIGDFGSNCHITSMQDAWYTTAYTTSAIKVSWLDFNIASFGYDHTP